MVFICLLIFISTAIYGQSSNFTEGKKALNEGDLDVALEYFNKDLSDNPNSSLTYLYRAWLYYSKSENAKALNDINAGLKFTTSKEKELVAVLYELRAKTYFDLAEPEKALADYTNAIKIYGTNPDYASQLSTKDKFVIWSEISLFLKKPYCIIRNNRKRNYW